MRIDWHIVCHVCLCLLASSDYEDGMIILKVNYN